MTEGHRGSGWRWNLRVGQFRFDQCGATVENRGVDERRASGRWMADGKFFSCGGRRVVARMVTYGPFPGGWPDDPGADFGRMVRAGFHAVRLYDMPDRRFLDAAGRHGLAVFAGLKWGQNADFFRRPGLLAGARVELVRGLRECGGHPALAGVFVGNEIPTDLVRWMGPLRVRRTLEDLISLGRSEDPGCLFAYANYPSTEYLEPENADFTAFNIYLEERRAFRGYLKRLHHIAGDRPLVVSEFGMDSRRNGLDRQAETLVWAAQTAEEEDCAGFTVYAWSDRWWNNGAEVEDWDFGLNDRQGMPKPALAALEGCFRQPPAAPEGGPSISVVVCTRNGRDRLPACLNALAGMKGGGFEIIVVDDGSDDGTADWVERHYPAVRLLRSPHVGLSVARNAGAAMAAGQVIAFTDDDCEPDAEWLARLRRGFAGGRFGAVGGPNLPPRPRSAVEAVVCAAPGGPSHVMIDDEEAEHLPGCNLAVSKAALDAVGGFDARFHTAGDDVDFCWRLRAAGFRLGFVPGAFVWHWRRPSIRAFLRQQIGYGRAERMLMAKHPEKFTRGGGAVWDGVIYAGGPVRVTDGAVLYHGPMGLAGYQGVCNRMLPLRGLDGSFDHWTTRLALAAVAFLVPRIRAWVRSRIWSLRKGEANLNLREPREGHEFEIPGVSREFLLETLLRQGWKPSADEANWDLERQGARVLVAREFGGLGCPNCLVRISGDPQIESEIRRAAGWSPAVRSLV